MDHEKFRLAQRRLPTAYVLRVVLLPRFGDNIFDSVSYLPDNNKPYDAFEHLCRSVFSDYRKGGILAYLLVYSDASYNQPYNQPSVQNANDPLLHTVGACIATDTDWRRFRKEWKLELDKKGHDHFHMKNFEFAQNAVKTGKKIGSKNLYAKWKPEDFIPYLQRLHKTINRKRKDQSFRINAFIASLVTADFNNVRPQELENDPGCKSAYIFNVVSVMEQIAEWANRSGYTDPIHYVFAGGDDEAGNLERWFDYCFNSRVARKKFRLNKGYTRFPLRPYHIEWMKEQPAIQAADILAYEYNKAAIQAAQKGNYKLDESEVRKSLVNLYRPSQRPTLLTETELAKAFPKMVKFKKRHASGFSS